MLLLVGGCSRGTVWRVPVEEFRSRLRSGSHDFLRHIDYKKTNSREAARLGAEAPYYLAVIYRSLSMPEMERRMVELGCRVSRGLHREECELRYVELLIGGGEPAEALRRSTAAASRLAGSQGAARLRRLRIEALWKLGRDEELLRVLTQHVEEAADPAVLLRDDSELVFYRAAASARLERPEWEDEFRVLAWDYRSTFAHQEALAFLEASAGRSSRFSEAEMALFRGKAALAEGRSRTGAETLRAALELLPAPSGSIVVEETARAYLALERYEEGLDFLRSVRSSVAEPWVVDEFEGRILRASGAPAEAALALEKAFRSSSDPGQRQRALWHYLDIRIRAGERGIGTVFLNRREYITDASFYEDLLDEALTAALARRDWRDIEAIRDFCREKRVGEPLARADFVIARAVSAGLLAPAASRDPAALLDEAITADPAGYYGLLASQLRRRPYERFTFDGRWAAAADGSVRPSSWSGGESAGDAASFVEGYFSYGLPSEGYAAAGALGDALAEDAVLDTAERLQASSHAAESIRLAATLSRRDGVEPSRRRLEVLYPALFISDIERVAGERGLPVPVVLGLVREESLFDPEIVSHAGAVGLTQLMPATAEEIAGRLGLVQPDLTDPLTNIQIGLRHLAGLRAATPLVRAVVAYNAGFGRLREWERELGTLPEELFAEAVPYSETRLYARRVVLSAVTYGVLYGHQTPEETVALFYPDLVSSGGR